MKNTLIIILSAAAMAMTACREEERGQYSTDGIPPGKVSNVNVDNVPGGAVLTYDIPDDDDLLYVRVVYRTSDGKLSEQKSSAYTPKIEVEGLGRSAKQVVKLICGDRSGNESAPVEVEIEPLDAPIYDIMTTLEMKEDFGGIRITWENPLKDNIALTVYHIDSDGRYHEAGNVYNRAAKGKFNQRGFAPQETLFGVTIRDRWGNQTDTLTGSFTPFFEEQLKREKFGRWNPPGIPYISLGWAEWEIEHMWDGVYGSHASGYSTPLTVTMPHSITFDMGQTAKVGRFKIYQRAAGDQLYIGYNVKKFQLWGSAHPSVNAGFDEWTYLGSYESVKPSGLPMGEKTQEDIDFALAGHEYDVEENFDIPVRYMRIVVEQIFGGSGAIQIAEAEFFGEIQDN